MTRCQLAFAIALLICLAACEKLGPDAITLGRQGYNDAIEMTSEQQLLRNIVRVHNNRPPLSVEVTQVIVGLSAAASLSGSIAGLGIGEKGGAFRTGSITSGTVNSGLSYSETPSIQYQPISGEALVRQYTTPIPSI